MGAISIDDILVTSLKRIEVKGGDVLHAMNDIQVSGFVLGEAYFSFVEPSFIKAWKRHKEMTLNLVVPIVELLHKSFCCAFPLSDFKLKSKVQPKNPSTTLVNKLNIIEDMRMINRLILFI